MRALAPAEPVVELRDDATPNRGAEFAERPWPLGDRYREQRLARLAELGPFGDEAQTIEIHVCTAQDHDERLIVDAGAADPGLEPGHGQGTSGFHHRPRV